MASITIQSGQLSIKFRVSDSGLEVVEEGNRTLTTLSCLKANTSVVHHHTWWNVVGAKVDEDLLRVDIINEYRHPSTLVTYRGRYVGDEAAAQAWAQKTLTFAYPNSRPGRKLQVLVNPFGGKGKGLRIFTQIVKPILDAGQCILNVTYTAYRNHAHKVVQRMPLDFDCIVTVSGDGLIHECLNGLADRLDGEEALRIPIAPIPAGSANAMCVNLMGIKTSFDVAQTCLNVLKGQITKLDLCSVAQDGKRSFSFLAQALGLMADLDFGTEHLRWMGEPRFIYGFLKGLIANRSCPVQVEFLNVQQDKQHLLSLWKTGQLKRVALPEALEIGQDVPHVGSEAKDEWVKFEKPWLYFVAGKLPYVARNLNQFPLASATDGLIDVAIQEATTRLDVLKSMDTGQSGQHFFLPRIHYMKCEGYRITPMTYKGYFSVDGERFPFETCEVSVRKGAASFLSPTGKFVNEFAGEKLI